MGKKYIPPSFPQGQTDTCYVHSHINAKRGFEKPSKYRLRELIGGQDHTDIEKLDDNALSRHFVSLS